MAKALDLLMSTKEDVNLLSEESDICTIDAKTRVIFVPSTIVVGGVQSDKNAERIKFSCPKIVGDNLDLSKFSVRINFENVSSVDFNVSIKDQYICDDVAVDGENVTFSWLIGRNAARYMGTVRFIVCAVKTDSDSNISVEWNTAIAEVPVLEGIEIDQPQIGQEEKDVINQLLELTKNTSAEAVQNVNSAKEQAIKDIQSVSQPDTTLTIEGGLAEAKATGEAIGSLKEDLVEYQYGISDRIVFTKNVSITEFDGNGYYTNDGTHYDSSTYKYVELNVTEGDSFSVDGNRIRFVCAYVRDNIDTSLGYSGETSEYTVPSTVTKIIITVYNIVESITWNKHSIVYTAKKDYINNAFKTLMNPNSERKVYENVTSGVLATLDNFPYYIKKNYGITFLLKFSSFTYVSIGKGYNTNRGTWIEVSQNKVFTHKYYGSESTPYTDTHALNISDYLMGNIYVDDDGFLNITLNSNGGTFTARHDIGYDMAGQVFIRPSFDCYKIEVGAYSKDLSKPIWCIGDSYFSIDDTRVMGQIKNLGYMDKFLVCGIPGLDSNRAEPDIERMLNLSKPKTIVWYIGMNDTENHYTNYFNKLNKICSDNCIELILNNVPSIPTQDKSYITSIINSKGYRYIDSADAVGTNTSGVWYEGYLSDDNVHPSELGAKALAMRMLVDVPELMY